MENRNRRFLSPDSMSHDGSTDEVYSDTAGVAERKKFWTANTNRSNQEEDTDDESSTLSNMSQLFRNARGVKRQNPEHKDHDSDRRSEDSKTNSLSDAEPNTSVAAIIAALNNKKSMPLSPVRNPPTVTRPTYRTHTTTAKLPVLTTPTRQPARAIAEINPVVSKTTKLETAYVSKLKDVNLDEEKGPDVFDPVLFDNDTESESDDFTPPIIDPPAPKEKSKRKSMSNRRLFAISSIFIGLTAIAIVVGFHIYYKKHSGLEANSSETSHTTNLRSPTAAPTVVPTTSPSLRAGGHTSSPTIYKNPVATPTIPNVVQPTMKPTKNYIDPLMEFLQDNQVYFEKDRMSPDYMAVEFMAEEAQSRSVDGVSSAYGNGLEYDEKSIQRFAVLTMDFALNDFQELSGKAKAIRRKEVDECNWEGIVCADVGPLAGKVVEVRLPHSDLKGSIPPEIKLLQNLKVLDLAANELQGSIPESLYSIKELEELYLFQNHLTGTISTEIKNWYNLTRLHLSHNELSGTIPTTFKSGTFIRPIEYLNLYSNRLTGTIPDLRFRKTTFADFGRNQLTGTLPDDIGERWVELRHLFVDHNDFTGTIPPSYTTVGNGRVEILSFNHNRLTGEAPGEFLHHHLGQYNLHNNSFAYVDQNACKESVFHSGEMAEFSADCDVCVCDVFCDKCDPKKNKN